MNGTLPFSATGWKTVLFYTLLKKNFKKKLQQISDFSSNHVLWEKRDLLLYPIEENPYTWNRDSSANRAINTTVCMLLWVHVIVCVRISPVTALCTRQMERVRTTATAVRAMRGCQCPCFRQQSCIILSLPQQHVRQAVFLSLLLWAGCTV